MMRQTIRRGAGCRTERLSVAPRSIRSPGALAPRREPADNGTHMTAAKGHGLAASSRRAWVTGASAGIGEAFARRLARDHFDLALVARSRERLAALAAELEGASNIHCDVVPADLTVAPELQRVAALIADDAALELLVNNAGFGTVGRFAELDAEREEAEIRLNIIALTHLTRAALPGLIRRGHGAVINVSSMAAFQPAPHNAT